MWWVIKEIHPPYPPELTKSEKKKNINRKNYKSKYRIGHKSLKKLKYKKGTGYINNLQTNTIGKEKKNK